MIRFAVLFWTLPFIRRPRLRLMLRSLNLMWANTSWVLMWSQVHRYWHTRAGDVVFSAAILTSAAVLYRAFRRIDLLRTRRLAR